jgi:hypothetical protein
MAYAQNSRNAIVWQIGTLYVVTRHTTWELSTGTMSSLCGEAYTLNSSRPSHFYKHAGSVIPRIWGYMDRTVRRPEPVPFTETVLVRTEVGDYL